MHRGRGLACLILILVGVAAVGCSSIREPLSLERREALLLARAERFFKLMDNKQYEHMFAMSHESVRGDNTAEAYAANMKTFFEDVSISHGLPKIVSVDDDIGLTVTMITLEIEHRRLDVCMSLEWKWDHDNWYMLGSKGTCEVLQ